MGNDYTFKGTDPKSYDHELETRISDALGTLSREHRTLERVIGNQSRGNVTSASGMTRQSNMIRKAYADVLSSHLALQSLFVQKHDWIAVMDHAERASRIADLLRQETKQPNHGCMNHPIYQGGRSGGCVACNPERMSD